MSERSSYNFRDRKVARSNRPNVLLLLARAKKIQTNTNIVAALQKRCIFHNLELDDYNPTIEHECQPSM